MGANIERLKQSIVDFVRSQELDYAFPLGGKIPLFSAEERAVCELLRSCELDDDAIRVISDDFTRTGCYEMAILGARLMLAAARSKDAAEYKVGLFVFLAAAATIDWRDILVALSVVEEFGNFVGVNVKAEAERILGAIPNDDLTHTVMGFFERPEGHRRPEYMDLERIGEGDTLTFVRKPW